MAKLQIAWTSPADLTVHTGEDAQSPNVSFEDARILLDPSALQEGKPFVVYVKGADEEAQKLQEVLEGTTLKDERVAIASKAFVMIRMDGSELTDTHPFQKHLRGRKLPRIVLFDSEGDRVAALEGSISPSKLFSAMKKTFRRDYKGSLDSIVKNFQKILTEIDTLDTLEKALAEKEKRATTSRAKREIQKKREQIAKKKLQLQKKEKELLAFRMRKPKADPATAMR